MKSNYKSGNTCLEFSEEYDNKTEDIFEVEETVDFEKLKKENHKKYREVYAQLEALYTHNWWPFNTVNKDALKKLRSSELYYEALKTGFFIEAYTEKIKYLGMDLETVNLIKGDVAKVCGGDISKYDDLLYWLGKYYRRTYPRPKEILMFLIYAIVASLIIGVFLTIGVLTHKAVFFLICPILLCVFILGMCFLFSKAKTEKPLK